jgi:hypothetical protein
MYLARIRECFCNMCMQKKYRKCTNKIQEPKSITATFIQMLEPKGREKSTLQSENEEDDAEEFIVEKIVEHRKNKVIIY